MTTTNLTALIDAYAATKSQLGKLEAEKKKLEAALAEVPAGAYESEDNRLCISDSVRLGYDAELADKVKAATDAATRAVLDGLSRQYLQAHTIEKTIRTHRIGLPTGKGLSA
jgi:hypothetical protein